MIEERTASEVAGQLAEAARTLNYLTLPADGAPGLEYPADVYEVIGDLKVTAQRLPQLLGQLSDWLLHELDAGRVGVDAPSLRAALQVGKCTDALESAAGAAKNLERHLNWAHNDCSHLTGGA